VTDLDDDLRSLSDYVSGAKAETEIEEFEAQLFARAALGEAPEAEFLDRVALLGRTLQQRAGLEIGGRRARIDELRAKGFRVAVIEAKPGLNQPPPWDPDAEIVVTDYVFDLRGYTNIDVDVETSDGERLKTFRDVSCDPDDGHVYAICEAPLARLAERVHCRLRVYATRDGTRREVVVVETLPAR